MAAQQRNDSERFTEMEYMLNKYYNEHCAKIVSSEIKTFNERQKIEYQKEYDEYLRNFGYNAVQGFHPRGDWARKGAEDLMNDIDARLKDDTVLQADLKAMAERWKQWAIARMGKEKYDYLSSCTDEKDLALVYVKNRFKQQVFDQLARSRMPKSTADYFVQQVVSSSFLDWLSPRYLSGTKSDFDSKLADRAEELYNPSFLEKYSGIGAGIVLDQVALGPFFKVGSMMFKAGKAFFTAAQAAEKGSAAGKAATAVVRASVADGGKVAVSSVKKEVLHLAEGNFVKVSGDGAKQALLLPEKYAVEHAREIEKASKEMLVAANTDPSKVASVAKKFGLNVALVGICTAAGFMGCTPDEVDREISAAVSGNEESFSKMRSNTKNVKPYRSEFLHAMNDQLSMKVKLPAFRIPYSPTSVNSFRNKIAAAHEGDVEKCHELCNELLTENGLSFSEEKDVPGWMLQKSPDELVGLSDYYTATALEMKRCGMKEITIGKRKLSLDEVSQTASDYSRAAVTLQQQERQAREEQEALAAKAASQRENDMPTEEETVRKQQQGQAQDQWGGLMETLGLKGAGDLSDNLGYTLAMLPDMIFGMLTGKTKNLRIEDNIFPLMAIFGGMFMKNPILKWLLIGLGSVNLLNKGFGELSGRDAQQQQAKTYRRYADEPISPRVKFHGIRDGQLIIDIDGQANMVRVSPDSLKAYREGSLSEGALCNAVLKEYDAFVEASRRQYELDAQRQQDRQVVRMGVG